VAKTRGSDQNCKAVVDNQATRRLLKGHPMIELQGGHALTLENPGLLASAVHAWLTGSL